jgi:hypothetical protein
MSPTDRTSSTRRSRSRLEPVHPLGAVAPGVEQLGRDVLLEVRDAPPDRGQVLHERSERATRRTARDVLAPPAEPAHLGHEQRHRLEELLVERLLRPADDAEEEVHDPLHRLPEPAAGVGGEERCGYLVQLVQPGGKLLDRRGRRHDRHARRDVDGGLPVVLGCLGAPQLSPDRRARIPHAVPTPQPSGAHSGASARRTRPRRRARVHPSSPARPRATRRAGRAGPPARASASRG